MFTRASRVVISLLALMALSAVGLAQDQKGSLQLRAGTAVKLEVKERLESGKAKAGQTFDLTVMEDVKDVDGHVLIRKGAPATGKVLKSQRGGPFRVPAKLEVEFESVEAADGQKAALRMGTKKSGSIIDVIPEQMKKAFLDKVAKWIKEVTTTPPPIVIEPSTPLTLNVGKALKLRSDVAGAGHSPRN